MPDPHINPYPEHRDRALNWGLVCGDLNRMETDYLDPVYPEPPCATRPEGSDPATQVATATGVDIETVRAVLRYVFLEQR